MSQILVLICLILATLQSPATLAVESAGVSDAELAQLITAMARDPAAINRQHTVLQRLSAVQMAQAIESTGNSHFTWLYPMILRAQDYPQLANTPIVQMSVLAVRGDKLIPIPFQIDEFDTRGLIYIPGTATPGPLNPGLIKRTRKADGVAGRFDNSDELVFMYRDAGLRQATPEELAKVTGKVLGIVELHRDGLAARYAYVMQGQPLRSSADYVRIDLAHGTAQTSVADIAWDPDSMAMLKRIAPRVGPSSGVNIVDGVYGEVSTGILQKNLRFSLNTSDNIRAQPVAVRDGPVRAVILIKLRIFYLGVPIFHDFINIALYEQGASLLAHISAESLDAVKYFVNMIKDPRIEATIDFADMHGAEVRWHTVDSWPEKAIVDGQMSSIENAMDTARFPGDWLWMDSKRGWQFFFSNNFAFEDDGMIQAFLEGMTVDMVYEDDPNATREGERIPGAGPRFGVRTSGLPLLATSLLTTLRGIDLSKLKGFEDLIDQMIVLENKGKLERLNKHINLIQQRLIQAGRLNSLEELAELLAKDIDRMGFKPDDKAKLVRIVRRSVLEGGNLHEYRLGHVLKAAKRIAPEEGFDLNNLQFALLDNSIWFPDTVGAGGPAAFDREVRNPPTATLLPP